MLTCLVTGANGLIGSHLCERLLDDGHALVRTSRQNCDIRDPEAVNRIFSSVPAPVDVVFHLAACLPHSAQQDYYESNVVGTKNLLATAREAGVKTFIYASSMSVYHSPPMYLPVPETHPVVLNLGCKTDQVGYGLSKLRGELLCKRPATSDGIRTVILRFASVYGVGDTARVTAKLMKAALENETLWVDGSGQQSSDFVYVDDAVRGILSAWELGVDKDVYNIGSGQETSIQRLAEEIVRVTRSGSKIRRSGHKPRKQYRFAADITRARKALGYDPLPLEAGLNLYAMDLAQKEYKEDDKR